MHQPTQPSFDPELAGIVAASKSLAEVMRALGRDPESGGARRTVYERIVRAQLDTSHFVWKLGPVGGRAPQILTVLAEGSHRESAYRLRTALWEHGVEYVCAKCGQPPRWKGRELTLHVDHINGDALDCRLHNLRFLCPNCHSQTETFGRGKRKARRVAGYLTPSQVREIRALWGPYEKGKRGRLPAAVLADHFGVSQSTINHVVQGRKWRGVREEPVTGRSD